MFLLKQVDWSFIIFDNEIIIETYAWFLHIFIDFNCAYEVKPGIT